MIAVEPDAWDECATCGHDREDHDEGLHCDAPADTPVGLCSCLQFNEDAV